jgi:hypothetical protein
MERGKETRLFAMPFVYKNDHFAKTGSGQTEGKHSKKDAFLQAVAAGGGESNDDDSGRSSGGGGGGGGFGGGGNDNGSEREDSTDSAEGLLQSEALLAQSVWTSSPSQPEPQPEPAESNSSSSSSSSSSSRSRAGGHVDTSMQHADQGWADGSSSSGGGTAAAAAPALPASVISSPSPAEILQVRNVCLNYKPNILQEMLGTSVGKAHSKKGTFSRRCWRRCSGQLPAPAHLPPPLWQTTHRCPAAAAAAISASRQSRVRVEAARVRLVAPQVSDSFIVQLVS